VIAGDDGPALTQSAIPTSPKSLKSVTSIVVSSSFHHFAS
jgi:hypothetical protein